MGKTGFAADIFYAVALPAVVCPAIFLSSEQIEHLPDQNNFPINMQKKRTHLTRMDALFSFFPCKKVSYYLLRVSLHDFFVKVDEFHCHDAEGFRAHQLILRVHQDHSGFI